MEKVSIQFSFNECTILNPLPDEINEALFKMLSYHPKGYFFAPKYQAYMQAWAINDAVIKKGGDPPNDLTEFKLYWDGFIRLYRRKTQKFSVGLLDRVIKYFEETYNADVEIVGKPKNYTFVQHTNTYTLRNYQFTCVNAATEKRIGIIKAPPRSGKTIVAIALTDSEEKFPTIFLCRSIDLARQAVAEFKKFLPYSVGMVGDGCMEIQDITVMTIQSVFSAFGKILTDKGFPEEQAVIDKKAVRKNLIDSKTVFYDECFPRGTLICIDKGKYLPIEYVYKNKSVTHILSYNDKTKQLEKKKILRRYKHQAVVSDMFEVRSGDLYVRPTKGQPFWTENRGYVAAEELTLRDKLKVLVDISDFLKETNSKSARIYKNTVKANCPICSKICRTYTCLADHMRIWHSKNSVKIRKSRAAGIDYEAMVIKREENGKWRKSLKAMGLRRLGKNNPIFRNPDTIYNLSKNSKTRFALLPEKKKKAQILRFMNAPRHHSNSMNKPETIVNNFSFEGLSYTGNGYHVNRSDSGIKIRLGRKDKYKFPDFTYTKENKVIEIADFEYWHSNNEMLGVKRAYKRVGYDCLILDAKQVVTNPETVKLKIYKFLYNHNVKPDVLKFNDKGYVRDTVTVYNFMVEDNNNYFANGFLVHNCHHSGGDTSQFVLDKCKNAEMIIGFSATPHNDEDDSIIIENVMGPVIADIGYSELIRDGYLLRPTIYMYKLPKHELSKDDSYKTIYRKEVVENDFLSGLIAKIVKTLNAQGDSVVVQTEFVNHTKSLAKIIGCAYLTGKEDSKKRIDLISKLKDKKILVLVSTLFEEGLDIPSLDFSINVAGNLSNITTFQRMRSITATDGKTTCGIIDFFHQCKYLHRHSLRRKKLYLSEPEFDYQERDVSKKTLEEII